MTHAIRRIGSVGLRTLARRSARADRRFGVRTVAVPDGRTLWLVLEARRDDVRDVSNLRLALTSGDTVLDCPVDTWSGPAPLMLSAAIDITPLTRRDARPRRVDVWLVEGNRRRHLGLLDGAATSTDRYVNLSVPDPERAVHVVPAATRGDTLAIEVRAVATVWATGTTFVDGILSVHGQCVPADAPPPTAVTLSDSTAPDVPLQLHQRAEGHWSASTSLAALVDAAGAPSDGSPVGSTTTWTVTADGEPLLRRPAAARTAALVRPQWDFGPTAAATGQLSCGFRKGAVLTVDLEWGAS